MRQGGPTASNLFCNLRAIETSLDGTYVLLADGGKLLRYNLFTDGSTGLITQLQASILTNFKAICSIGVLGPDGAILLHDCGTAQVHVAMQDGTHVQLAGDFSDELRPARLNLKSFYDRRARYMVTAGVMLPPSSPIATSEQQGCIAVRRLLFLLLL